MSDNPPAEPRADNPAPAAKAEERLKVANPPEQPLMLWDGDCRFCGMWIRRWHGMTGDRVEYVRSQIRGSEFPEIPVEEFGKRVYLIETDGTVYGGSAAVFQAFANVPGKRWLPRLYKRSSLFAKVTESAYKFVAKNRYTFSVATRTLWGKSVTPPTYRFARQAYMRGLGVVSLIAVISIWVQLMGLIGNNGILPAAEYRGLIDNAYETRDDLTGSPFWRFPSLLWLNSSDAALHLCAGLAAAGSVALMTGMVPLLGAAMLWLGYLSLVSFGQVFLSFQWDNLLLEMTLLAALWCPLAWRMKWTARALPALIPRLLVWWLMFRLMFESGIVKLQSFSRSDGSNTWRDGTALDFHYWTQPIPTWTSSFIHHLPNWIHVGSLWIMFAVELIVPFLMLGPRRVRMLAFWLLVLLQLGIIFSGNYGFFNLLTIVLALALIDDQSLPMRLRRRLGYGIESDVPGATCTVDLKNDAPDDEASPSRWTIVKAWSRRIATIPAAVLILGITSWYLWNSIQRNPPTEEDQNEAQEWLQDNDWAASTLDAVQPFRSINSYGLFRVMTTTRPEIKIEGSVDGITWETYEFRWKMESLDKTTPWITGHMPRLDWRMWFAALNVEATGRFPPWLERFLGELAENDPVVTALLRENPFEDSPPEFLRVTLWQYRFVNRDGTEEEANASEVEVGEVWERERVGGATLRASQLRQQP